MEELSLHILDIAQNAIEAGAGNINIIIDEDGPSDALTIRVIDDGRGIPEDILEHITDPFTTSRKTRRVGLGIPLFHEAATTAGGDLEVLSEPGKGTEIKATFKISNIDRAPLGDMAETMALLIVCNPHVNFKYAHTRGKDRFACTTDSLAESLGGTPISSPSAVSVIRDIINEGLRHVQMT